MPEESLPIDPFQEPVYGPNLLDRIRKLEERIAHLEATGGTALSGTDQTIAASHDRLDLLTGAAGTGAFLELGEQSPTAPAADKLRVYAKDYGGLTRLATKDSGGKELYLRNNRLHYNEVTPHAWDWECNTAALPANWSESHTTNTAYDLNSSWKNMVHWKIWGTDESCKVDFTCTIPAGENLQITACFFAPILFAGNIVNMIAGNDALNDAIAIRWSRNSSSVNQAELFSVDSGTWTCRALDTGFWGQPSPWVTLHLDWYRADNSWKGWVGWDGYGGFIPGGTGWTKSTTLQRIRMEVCHQGAYGNRRNDYGFCWFRRNFMSLWNLAP